MPIDPPRVRATTYRRRRRRRTRSARVVLTASQIDGFVERGYLALDSRNDIRAIGFAATAFISNALFGT
jgi:hypothetical protein